MQYISDSMVPPNRRNIIRIDPTADEDGDDPVIILPAPPALDVAPQPSDLDVLADALETLYVRDPANDTLYETPRGLTPHW